MLELSSPALAVRAQVGIEGRHGDPNLLVRRRHLALGAGDVRPSFEQLRRNLDRNRRRKDVQRSRRNRELRGSFADQDRDGVFKRGALHAKIHQLRLHSVQLRLGLGNVEVRCDSELETVLRQREVFLIRRLSAGEQLGFGVAAVEFEIILREFSLVEQPRICHGGRQRLRGRGARRHTAANVSPEVRLPGNVERQTETGVGYRMFLFRMFLNCFQWR